MGSGDVQDAYLPTSFCDRLTAASRNVILLACPMHEQGCHASSCLGSCQGLGHGQDGGRHGQLSGGELAAEIPIIFTLACLEIPSWLLRGGQQ